MKLERFTDLSLRTFMVLARTDERVSTAHISELVGAPESHMAKVVARLAGMGLIDSRRGRGGGLLLAPGALETTVGAVVRELEGDGDVVGCTTPTPCPLLSGCALRSELAGAKEAFLSHLDGVEIGGLVRRSSALDLLAPSAPSSSTSKET